MKIGTFRHKQSAIMTEIPRNIQLFNIITADILSNLYISFPVKLWLSVDETMDRISTIAEKIYPEGICHDAHWHVKDDKNENNHILNIDYFWLETMRWLCRVEYLYIEDENLFKSEPRRVGSIVLSEKGLRSLNVKISSLDEDKSTGEILIAAIGWTSKTASSAAISKIIEAIFSVSVKSFID